MAPKKQSSERFTLSPFFNKAESKVSTLLENEIVCDPAENFGLSTSRCGRPKDFDELNVFFCASVPLPIRKTFQDMGYLNIYTNHIYDIYTRESEDRETDPYDRRKRYGQMGGLAHAEEKLAVTAKEQWVGKRGFLISTNSSDKVLCTLLHEFSHLFSRVFRLENLSAFADALDYDIRTNGGYQALRGRDQGYLTPCNKRLYRHREEAWAELCAVAIGSNDADAQERAAMFPNAYRVVQEMINNIKAGLDNNIDFLTLRAQIRESFGRDIAPDRVQDYGPN